MYQKTSKISLFVFAILIVISIGIFGLTIYNGSKPVKLTDSDIKITERPGVNPNEKIITVEAPNDVVFYSFDGGETFQTDNSYAISENKSISIVLQDNERRTIGKKDYNVSVVATTAAPTIDLKNVPSEIKTGSKIDVNSLATATDQNNNKIDVVADTNIDMSKPGIYNITYTATDTDGRTTKITTQVVVTDDTSNSTKPGGNNGNTGNTGNNGGSGNNGGNSGTTTPTKKTYYRYRTNNVTTYECNYYNCDYTDYNITVPATYTFDKNSYCCNVSGCKKSSSVRSKYSSYGRVCYSNERLKNGVNYLYSYGDGLVGGEMPPMVPIQPYQPGGNNYVPLDPTQDYTIRDEETCEIFNEFAENGTIFVDGYCYEIVERTPNASCPSGYEGGTTNPNVYYCYKKVSKTCSNTCTEDNWTEWSPWSTTKVIPSDTVEVQTKTE